MSTEVRDHALCNDLTPQQSERLFFGHGAIPTLAKRFCEHCPVREACLREADRLEAGINAQHVVGFRGGLTSVQRVERRKAAVSA